jgi:phosphogluconate dehydratase
MVHTVLQEVTDRIIARSKPHRQAYLDRMNEATISGVHRSCQSCSGLAHNNASASADEKLLLAGDKSWNIGIVSAATDMLSAHQPFLKFPDVIKDEALAHSMTAQIATHTTAMCDGTTQGQKGMHLSLLSRDVIARDVAIGLSHNTFDAVVAMATCDKIKPGFEIGLSSFGHLPVIFAPGGPMSTGQSNGDKNKVRELVAQGLAGKKEELASEMRSYHGPGTCTFYGTANTNEMMAEILGLQLPGSSFIPPNTPERDAMTRQAVRHLANGEVPKWHEVITEKTIVNAIVALHATGGSTNCVLHLPAVAAANGISITLQDIEDLSEIVPSVARIYPNGPADINQYQQAGGMPVLMQTLLDGGLLHEDVKTVAGTGLSEYTKTPQFHEDGSVTWVSKDNTSRDASIITTVEKPFSPTGGIKVMHGILGEGIAKVSALKDEHRRVSAPARVFDTELGLQQAFQKGELTGDFIAVVRGQGAWQTGMPELHKLITPLKVLQGKGQNVGLVTNGRLSGASGSVPSVIHVCQQDEKGMPMKGDDEPMNKIQDGDIITIDTNTGELIVHVPEKEWAQRLGAKVDPSSQHYGLGRELFAGDRARVTAPQRGASSVVPPLLDVA